MKIFRAMPLHQKIMMPLVFLGVAAMALFVREALRHRRRGMGRRAFALNMAFAAVAQAAAALVIHLPTGCSATSTAAAGRLSLDDEDLKKIYEGTDTTWGQLTDGGDTISGTDTATSQPCGSVPISVVVRLDGSGTHLGPVGAGQAAKAVNQVILAGTYLGVAEGLVLALKSGLDPEQVVAALSGGAAQSWVLANRSGRMLANDYPLGFKVALHLKDLGIALDMARESGAVLPVAALAAQLEAGLVATGHADDDMSALARAIRSLSGLDA